MQRKKSKALSKLVIQISETKTRKTNLSAKIKIIFLEGYEVLRLKYMHNKLIIIIL